MILYIHSIKSSVFYTAFSGLKMLFNNAENILASIDAFIEYYKCCVEKNQHRCDQQFITSVYFIRSSFKKKLDSHKSSEDCSIQLYHNLLEQEEIKKVF